MSRLSQPARRVICCVLGSASRYWLAFGVKISHELAFHETKWFFRNFPGVDRGIHLCVLIDILGVTGYVGCD